MKEGDFIVGIGDKDVKWASHEQVVRMIKQCGDFINLKLVTPMDRNYLKVNNIYSLYTLIKKIYIVMRDTGDTLIIRKLENYQKKIFLRTCIKILLIRYSAFPFAYYRYIIFFLIET